MKLRVRVRPGARRNAIEGERGGALLVSVTAPADRGRANEAVVALLAETAGVPKSTIEIRSGAGSRDKSIEIDTADPENLMDRLIAKRIHSKRV